MSLSGLLICGVPALTLAFPFLALFGFFEDRKQSEYQFRAKRFLVVIVGLVILNIAVIVPTFYGLNGLITGALDLALPNVLNGRAVSQSSTDTMGVMFPDILGSSQVKLCYQSALSNYIEDQWNGYFHSKSCEKKYHICGDNEPSYFLALLNQRQGSYTLESDLSLQGVLLQNIWETAAQMYKLARRITQRPDKDGNIPEPPDEQMIAQYHQYFVNWLHPSTLQHFRIHKSQKV